MALPKIDSPIFTIELPSNKREFRFRPFTVKEEKLLLMAAESNDNKMVSDTVKQVLTNCFIDDVDIDDLAVFDVEYIFIQLRSKSVNNIIELKFKGDDDKTYESEIDLNDAQVQFDPEHTNKIQLSDQVMITMRYPSFSMFEDFVAVEEPNMVEVLSQTIDKVINGEEIMSLKDYSKEEIEQFVDSFTSKNMREIEKFFQTLPKLKIDVTYVDAEGTEKSREIVGLQSFFT